MAFLKNIIRQIVLGQSAERTAPAQPTMSPVIPDGTLVYAVGDIHGRVDCLERLIQAIQADAATAAVDPARVTIIFLGDYVDRADESRSVIDRCLKLRDEWPGQVLFLRGNHEEALMDFLRDPLAGRAWLSFGGLSTLMSYGVADIASHSPDARIVDAREQFHVNLPDSHRQFYETTIPYHVIGKVSCRHAGIDPTLAPEAQVPRTRYWGGGSGEPTAEWPHVVVHGHHVVDSPENTGQRINVDTGAYFSGKLTAARIENGDVSFVQS